MRKLIILISILVYTEFLYSQQLPHYSLYMFNDAIINPAVVGTKNSDYVTLLIRNQWIGIEGAPKTQLISLEKKYNEIYGIGGGIINDKTGPISRLSGTLSGAKRYYFDDHTFSIGVSGIISQYKLDDSQLILENDGNIDPSVQGGLEKTLEHSITLGGQYIHNNYFLGLSIPSLLGGKLNVSDNGGKNKIISHYFLNTGYNFLISEKIDLETSLMLKKTDPTAFQMDVNVQAVYNNLLMGGISFRTQDAIVIMLGLEYLDYRIAYSYDVTTSPISIPSSGSHGIMFSYRIKQVAKDADQDGVLDINDNCPKIPGLIELNGCPDKDRDGIKDGDDECPDFPGLAINNGCPDRDADNVIDKYDRCPDVPGKIELNGCPDSDNDGLRDDLDRCPNAYGTIENFGCPEEVKIERVEHQVLRFVFEHLEFEFAKSILTFASQNQLNKAGQYLAEKPQLRIKVIGHTDEIGSERYNNALSKERALAVKEYLVERGINASRIKVEYFGKSKPIDNSGTEQGRAKNRRVEFEIIED